MRLVAAPVFVLAAALAASAPAADDPKPKKPKLDVRATPRMAFSPVNVLITAELTGGDDAIDDYYCPEIEWDWDDGGKSVHEADCDPLETGAAIERRYTANHAFRRPGSYNVKMTMRKGSRAIAAATATVTVQPGAGDMASSERE